MITLRRAAAQMLTENVQVSSPPNRTMIGKLVEVGEDCLCLLLRKGDGEAYHVYINLAHVVSIKVVPAPYAKEPEGERD